jgi:hypothetical protein
MSFDLVLYVPRQQQQDEKDAMKKESKTIEGQVYEETRCSVRVGTFSGFQKTRVELLQSSVKYLEQKGFLIEAMLLQTCPFVEDVDVLDHKYLMIDSSELDKRLAVLMSTKYQNMPYADFIAGLYHYLKHSDGWTPSQVRLIYFWLSEMDQGEVSFFEEAKKKNGIVVLFRSTKQSRSISAS